MYSQRVNHQPIFILNSTPWRETSLRLEVFSQDYGRVSLIARSARTRGSELRGILVPFIPLSASWYGKEELKTLHRATWLGGWQQPKNQSLFSSLYINELVLKLTAKEDPHPQLFHHFQQCHQNIAQQNNPTISLRLFEWQLLTELGLAPSCLEDKQGQPIKDDQLYRIRPEHAAELLTHPINIANSVIVSGSLLKELQHATINHNSELSQALAMTRLLLNHQLPEGIKSRQILQQLNQMKQNHSQAA